MEKFAIGLVVGGLGGALLAVNSYRMRALMKKGQEEIKERLGEMMDDGLKMMESAKEGAKPTVRGAAEKTGKAEVKSSSTQEVEKSVRKKTDIKEGSDGAKSVTRKTVKRTQKRTPTPRKSASERIEKRETLANEA